MTATPSGSPSPNPGSVEGAAESIAVVYVPTAMNPATPMLNSPVYPQWRFSASTNIP